MGLYYILAMMRGMNNETVSDSVLLLLGRACIVLYRAVMKQIVGDIFTHG